MESWQELRLTRAKTEPIYVRRVDCAQDGFIFSVRGVSGNYDVQIAQDVRKWPPTCTCEDSFWRAEADVLCKHILLVVRLCGVAEEYLDGSRYWWPEQQELYELLSKAPDCVGGCLAPPEDNSTKRLDESSRYMFT